MSPKLHDTLTEAIETIKTGSPIRKGSLLWRAAATPRIMVWKTTNAPARVASHDHASR